MVCNYIKNIDLVLNIFLRSKLNKTNLKYLFGVCARNFCYLFAQTDAKIYVHYQIDKYSYQRICYMACY